MEVKIQYVFETGVETDWLDVGDSVDVIVTPAVKVVRIRKKVR